MCDIDNKTETTRRGAVCFFPWSGGYLGLDQVVIYDLIRWLFRTWAGGYLGLDQVVI